MIAAIAHILTTSANRVTTPDANISLMLSMSLVMRVSRRPTGMPVA